MNTASGTLTPKSAFLTFLLLTSIKWLLVPSYRSTDFDVHRNWLALTRHLPVSEWYFDDINGTTVHTLDYPPLFAFFEYALGNNPVTGRMLESGWLDVRCLESLPDSTCNDPPPSDRCVRFHRGTVVFVGDVVLFVGAYIAAKSVSTLGEDGCERGSSYFTFASIVSNPGLIILDHVHFQYNGMLLGVLLISIACMVRGAGGASSPTSSSRWELLSAATYAGLLAMKHLYLTLAPLYFFYLLRRHCFVVVVVAAEEERKDGKKVKDDGHHDDESTLVVRFSWSRLLVLGGVSLLCFTGPFVPFLVQPDPVGQMRQILKRLFPFNRGLVHDYWAANIWAIYLFISKIATFVLRKAAIIPVSIRGCLESVIPFPEPEPKLVALLILIGVWPGGIDMAWKVGRWSLINPLCNPGKFFIHAVVFCSLSSFMLGYHVHEKAIMTAIIPMTLLATNTRHMARLFIRTCMFGLFGILPLLFRPDELLFKVVLYVGWMCGVIYALETIHLDDRSGSQRRRTVLTTVDRLSFVALSCVLIFMEVIHPIIFMPSGRLEFLPLMITSVICAVGLVWCWLESCSQMFFGSVRVAWR